MKRAICFLLAFLLGIGIFSNISLSAAEISDVSFSFGRLGEWKEFSEKTIFSDSLDCIKIQTDIQKDYYLSYKTWNEDMDGYFSAVRSDSSNSDDYAGLSGKRINRISINVYDESGNAIDQNIVVMYRAYVDGVWLPWVSNANEEWMSYVQRKYKLDGVLDTKSGNAGVDSSCINGLEIKIFEEESIDDQKGELGKSNFISVPFLCQLNQYPSGCESVSAVMALNYKGIDVTVDDFIDDYLEKSDVGNFDPNLTFGGDPRSNSGMGCYSPVIQKASEKVLASTGLTADNVSGLSLKELCEKYIDNGVPVIVWATQKMSKASTGKKWMYEDKAIQWVLPEHCLLLVGYDEENYIFNDPQSYESVTYYNKNKSENAYCALGCQAIVITNEALPIENYQLSETEYTYNGKVITPSVIVKDIDGTILRKDIDYTVTYDSGRKNVGKYKVIVKMQGNYSGTKTLYFNINPISSKNCSFKLSTTSYTYNQKVKTPNVVVKNANGTTLKKDTHYTVTYDSGRKNVGKYKVTVKMKGNYSGTKTLYFNINPISSKNCSFKLSTTSYTYNRKVKTPNVVVKNANGTTLKKGVHYKVIYDSGRKNVGKYKVTVKMLGNYSGTKTLTFKVLPSKTSITKVTAGKKSLKVYVGKKTTQVSGYQIQYSLSKKFANAKTKVISSNKTTVTSIKGLKANKTYYVRVRTFKTVNGVKYYSLWSNYKYRKTK